MRRLFFLLVFVFVQNTDYSQSLTFSVNGLYTITLNSGKGKVAEAGFLSLQDSSFIFESNDYYKQQNIDTSLLPVFLRKQELQGNVIFKPLPGINPDTNLQYIFEGAILGFLYFGKSSNPASDVKNMLLIRNDKKNKKLLLEPVGYEQNYWEIEKYWSRKSLSKQKAKAICDSLASIEMMKRNLLLSDFELSQKLSFVDEDYCWLCYYEHRKKNTSVDKNFFWTIRVRFSDEKPEIID